MSRVRDLWTTVENGRKVRNTRHGNGKRWLAVYLDPAGVERSRAFATKVDAELFLASTETTKAQGSWVDPALGKVTLAAWAPTWEATLGHLKPSTRYSYLGLLNTRVLPRWGSTPLARITYSDVAGWVTQLRQPDESGAVLSASRTRHAFRVLSLMLDLAVKDGRLSRNPCVGVKLPRIVKASKRYLSHAQVDALAAASDRYRVLVLVLAYSGVRWGEAVALRVGRLDLLRGQLTVAENAVEVGGRFEWGTPKSHESRTVPVPRFLLVDLAALCEGLQRDDLVFQAPEGGPVRYSNFRRRSFDAAAEAAKLDGLTPHELRHTAASLAISAGANVKVVQRMLGHATAAMTLDLYGHLFADDLEAVATRLDEARSVALAEQRRNRGSETVRRLA